ncbi:MAG: metallophosphoesterase family protein, partial [Actinomycetota bacterium]
MSISPFLSNSQLIRRTTGALLIGLVATACGFLAPVDPSQTPTPTPSTTETPSQELRFAAIGDFGSGWPVQHEVADAMCAWRDEHPFDVVITAGDNIYPDGAPRHFQDNFFEPYDCLLSNGVEFHASLGNHDYLTRRGLPEIEEPAFGMPKRNYVLRVNGVRFVIADSNRLDRAWLSEATRARPLDRWSVVVFHHPVFSPGRLHGSTPGYRPDLPRLFRR